MQKHTCLACLKIFTIIGWEHFRVKRKKEKLNKNVTITTEITRLSATFRKGLNMYIKLKVILPAQKPTTSFRKICLEGNQNSKYFIGRRKILLDFIQHIAPSSRRDYKQFTAP